MKRYPFLAIAAVSASVLAFGSTGCKKTIPGGPDGGMMDATADMADTGAAVVAEVDAGPAVPLATVVAPVAKPAAPTGGPFQGAYKCFGGMTATQNKESVTFRMYPGKTDSYSTMTCTVSGDVCDGKVTEYKAGKAGDSRHATMKRNDKGDLVYHGDGESQPGSCKKQ